MAAVQLVAAAVQEALTAQALVPAQVLPGRMEVVEEEVCVGDCAAAITPAFLVTPVPKARYASSGPETLVRSPQPAQAISNQEQT